MAGKNCSAEANTPLNKVQLTRRGRPLWWLKWPRPGRNGQRPAWNPAGAFPTCLQLPLQIGQVCVIWDILESVCIRYTLGEVCQIWEVRREVTLSGNTQPGPLATGQLHSHFLLSPDVSACSHCRKHLPFCQILLSLSLFPPFISWLHQHKTSLHLIPGLLGTLLDSEIFTARLSGNLLPFKLSGLVMVNSLLSLPNTGIPFED